MATTAEKRVIVIDVKGSKQAIKDLKDLQRHAASTDKNIARMGKTMGNLGFTIKAFIAYRLTAYVAGIGPAFLEAADSMSLMKSRLELANGEMGNTNAVMSELFDVAERSRGSIESISTLYTRLSVSAKELGASQQQVLDFTELVSDTFILSGASAGEAASGVTQISQAMAKGKLDGDEFKSVMENNIYFGELLGKTMGVTRGELLKLSKDGAITGDVLLKMGGSIDDIRKAMSDMPTTTAQAGTAWGNAFKKMIADSTIVGKALADINKDLVNIANNLGDYFDPKTALQDDIKALDVRINYYDDLIKRQNTLSGTLESAAESIYRNVKSFTGADLAIGVSLGTQDSNLSNLTEALRARAEKQTELERLIWGSGASNAPGVEGGTPGANTPPVASPFDKWVDSLKKADKELSLFNPKIEKLDELFFNNNISESVYNSELEKLTGNLSSASGGLSAFQIAQEELKQTSESLRTPLESMGHELSRLGEIAKNFPQLAGDVSTLQEKLLKNYSPDKKTESQEWIDWGKTAETAIGGITGSLVDMAVSGKNSFEDFAQSFLLNISKMILQQSVLNAIRGTSFGDSIGIKVTEANGDAFMNGNIVPFATGGIVNSPTLFPMSNGAGLMGEAGPEAIMPLKRGADGKLGVESSGGQSIVINQTITGASNEVLAQVVEAAAQKGAGIIANDARRGGGVYKAMRS